VARDALGAQGQLQRGTTQVVIPGVCKFITEWATSRSQTLREAADGRPVLLAYQGRLLHDNMKHENIHEEDILAAARERGIGRLGDLHAVVLEIDGQFSVIAAKDAGDDTLKDVRRAS
jgi:uncharacterized membrane protein YcaP (DUF421 family)